MDELSVEVLRPLEKDLRVKTTPMFTLVKAQERRHRLWSPVMYLNRNKYILMENNSSHLQVTLFDESRRVSKSTINCSQ